MVGMGGIVPAKHQPTTTLRELPWLRHSCLKLLGPAPSRGMRTRPVALLHPQPPRLRLNSNTSAQVSNTSAQVVSGPELANSC